VVLTAPSNFRVFGEGQEPFRWLEGTSEPPKECIFEGVPGCGKTRIWAEWIKHVCIRYPRSKGLVLRDTRVSLSDSFLPIWEEEVLGPTHPAVLGGPSRERREHYKHPALGGEVFLGGMDHPTKLFSTQYDWIYFNECQETSVDKWELLNRALRPRGLIVGEDDSLRLPFRLLCGDCNPADRYHWANRRMIAGKCKRLVGRFWDNPMYYDHAIGEWTDHGREYLDRLRKSLTGPRLRRLYYGEWYSAAGQVLADYDEALHVVEGRIDTTFGENGVVEIAGEEPRDIQWYLGAQDIGHAAPGVAGVWAFDTEDRAYRAAEVYWTGWNHEEWADVWAFLWEKFPFRQVVCDHDKAFISSLNNRLRKSAGLTGMAKPAAKTRSKGEEKAGIDDIRGRLKRREDGTFGMYLLKDAFPLGKDPSLVDADLPACLEHEIPAWTFLSARDGEQVRPDRADDPDPMCVDHAIDQTRYAMRFARDRTRGRREEYWPFPKGGVNDQLGLNAFFRKHGMHRAAAVRRSKAW